MSPVLRRLKRAAVDGIHRCFQIPALETLLVDQTQGRSIAHPLARLAPVNTAYGRSTLRTVTRDGICYRLDISDYQDWLIYWGITTDRPLEVYRLVQAGMVVFDVGANLGEVSLNMASRVGPSGRVFAFEPDPVSYDKFAQNLALNSFGNVVASQIGLGEMPGSLHMKVNCEGNRGGNRIAAGGQADGTFAIPVDTIDRFVERQRLERLDVIKIDVEGFELSVLKGARNTLQRLRPTLFVELSDSNLREQGVTAAQLVAFIQEQGYQVVEAESRRPLDGRAQIDVHCDIVCQPSSFS